MHCQECDPGYSMKENDNICHENECLCEFGDPDKGLKCLVNGGISCASCPYPFYYVESKKNCEYFIDIKDWYGYYYSVDQGTCPSGIAEAFFGNTASEKLTWSDADRYCKTIPGASLATVYGQTERDIIFNQVYPHMKKQALKNHKLEVEQMWTGLTRDIATNQYQWTGLDQNLIKNDPSLYPSNIGDGEDIWQEHYLIKKGWSYNGEDPEAQSNTGVKTKTFFKLIVEDDNERADYRTAKKRCRLLHPGSSLAAIYSKQENDLVQSLVAAVSEGDQTYWLGGDDSEDEGTFRWAIDYNGEENGEMVYSNWRDNEPDNKNGWEDCVEGVSTDEGKWNDIPCAKTLKFYPCQIRIKPKSRYCFSMDKRFGDIFGRSTCSNKYYPICQKRRCVPEPSMNSANLITDITEQQNCQCKNGKEAKEIDCQPGGFFDGKTSACIACNIGYVLNLETFTCYKSENYWSVHFLASYKPDVGTKMCAPQITINFAKKEPIYFNSHTILVGNNYNNTPNTWAKTAYKIGYDWDSLNSRAGRIQSLEIQAASDCDNIFSGRIRIDYPRGVLDIRNDINGADSSFEFENIGLKNSELCNRNSKCLIDQESITKVDTTNFCTCNNGFPHSNEECLNPNTESCKHCFTGYYLEEDHENNGHYLCKS